MNIIEQFKKNPLVFSILAVLIIWNIYLTCNKTVEKFTSTGSGSADNLALLANYISINAIISIIYIA